MFIVMTILLVSFVASQQINYDDHDAVIQRYTSVETDNVHIVRIKNIADKLETELDGLQSDISILRAQVSELDQVKSELQREDPRLAIKLDQINSKLAIIDSDIQQVQEITYRAPIPIETPKFERPSYFGLQSAPLLLVLFALLLTSFAVGSAMAKIQKKKASKPSSDVEKFVEDSLAEKEKVHDIKHQLLISGWELSDIEHAFQKVKEKRPELF